MHLTIIPGLLVILSLTRAIAGPPDSGTTADSSATVTADSSAAPTPLDRADGPPAVIVDLFIAKCSSCHSIGAGDRVGPDLKGLADRRTREWAADMIGNPSRMIASDPDARALVVKYNNVKMPDLGLSAEQIEALIDLIAFCSANACDLKGKFVPVAEATENDIRLGSALFTGATPLGAGGPPCISCHNVVGAGTVISGGTLARDLTNAFGRLGDEGLDAALRNPVFALMDRIFAGQPLAPEEAFALRAYLYQANRGALTQFEESRSRISVPLFGVLIMVTTLVVLNVAWSRWLK